MLLCEHITLFVKTIIVTRAYVLACIYAYQQVPCNWLELDAIVLPYLHIYWFYNFYVFIYDIIIL